MRVAALYLVARATLAIRARARDKVAAQCTLVELAAERLLTSTWTGRTRISDSARERESTRLIGAVESTTLPTFPLPLPMLPWAGDAGSAVLTRRRVCPSTGNCSRPAVVRCGFSVCMPRARG